MQLFRVNNGYVGDGPVGVIVIAANEERALELASKELKKDAEDVHTSDYWENLHATKLTGNTLEEFTGTVDE